MPLDLSQYSGKLTVTDGAWGTELQKRGLPAGAAPEFWNTENADAVEAVARSYVEAGSEIILSNTFGANAFVLARHNASKRAAELAERGAAISRKAAGSAAKVFASMGPTGKLVMMDELSEAELYAAFADSAKALARGGADAIVLETMTELAEVALAVQAVRENANLPVVVSLTYDSGPDKTVTMMGAGPADAVKQLAELGVSAFGANCGVGPEGFIKVVEIYRKATDCPIWIKANAGLPVVQNGKTTFPLSAKDFAAYVPTLAAAGANFIGGCCGTTPDHIREVRKAVDAMRK